MTRLCVHSQVPAHRTPVTLSPPSHAFLFGHCAGNEVEVIEVLSKAAEALHAKYPGECDPVPHASRTLPAVPAQPPPSQPLGAPQ